MEFFDLGSWRVIRFGSSLSLILGFLFCRFPTRVSIAMPTLTGMIGGTRTLLGAKGIATRSKKLLGAPGHTTRNKDATRNKGHRY